ncbi:MAG: GNAT family N-acetyltransferase [Candidatus Omnitrophica bacterium]|nr:GNAT family N-acetyltransferase [Candidatus Omnitrophota bacterium]
MRIRHMVESDLPAVLRMASGEGWVSDITEFRIFIEFNPFGCFICAMDGRILGSIMTFCHAESAWVGNFIVSKEYRGRGIGRRLLSQAIEYLDKKKKQIYVNAADDARKLYKKFDFKDVISVDRWQGKAVKPAGDTENPREAMSDILSFIELDARIWGDERFALISRLSSLRHSRSYFGLPGFLMYGNTGDSITIGPWEVKGGDEEIAEKLLISGLSGLRPGSKILLDVPAVNEKAARILARHKFETVGSTMFMCRGKSPRIHFKEIFSLATMGSMG